MTTPTTDIVWGIDIGGTKLAVAVGTLDGTVLGSDRFENDPSRSPESILSEALSRLESVSASLNTPNDALAIGVACPGPFDSAEDRFLAVPNMPAWQGFNAGACLRSLQSRSCALMNDANATALAESLWGAGRGARSLVYLTMSTGFGAGIVLDGSVYEGPRGFAGEVGRIVLAQEGPVGFGARGTAEGFLSGPGIEQQAASEALLCQQTGEKTGLKPHPDALKCHEVCALARDGDAAARRVTDRVAQRLGQLLGILVNVLEPEVVALGTIA